MKLDHIAIAAERLEDSVAALEERFGVGFAPGGKHPVMGTHNRLLSLGPDTYLEVIAVDPDAPKPARVRWFDLDRFSGPTRLNTWIAACEGLEATLARMPAGAGRPVALSRGDLQWQMAVPDDGRLPFDGMFPALIDWQGAAPPPTRLPDVGCRLTRLEVLHPEAERIAAALPTLEDPRILFVTGAVGLRAELETPAGKVML